MIKSRMENDACWPRQRDTVEHFDRLETEADRIADDMWIVEVIKPAQDEEAK